MGKGKIGEDVTGKKGGIITSAKESKEYQEWLEQEEEKRKKRLEEIKERMKDEGEPSDAELIKSKQEEMQKLAEAKAKGLLKPVHVVEHHRGRPRKEEEELK